MCLADYDCGRATVSSSLEVGPGSGAACAVGGESSVVFVRSGSVVSTARGIAPLTSAFGAVQKLIPTKTRPSAKARPKNLTVGGRFESGSRSAFDWSSLKRKTRTMLRMSTKTNEERRY